MKQKGFMLALTALTIFIISLTVLGSTQTNVPVDFSDEFIKIKTKITNYEVVLQQIALDCDWETNIENCLDENSQILISKLELNKIINCESSNFLIDGETATTTLTCAEFVDLNGNEFEVELSKEIKIKKY